MHRQEKSSKYKMVESTIHPTLPKASRAISGKDRNGLRCRASGTEPGANFDMYGESAKSKEFLGSPLSALPIKIELFHVTKPNRKRITEPPSHPALIKTNGKPSSPTP